MVEIHWGWIALGLLIAYGAGASTGRADGVAAERDRIKERWEDRKAAREEPADDGEGGDYVPDADADLDDDDDSWMDDDE